MKKGVTSKKLVDLYETTSPLLDAMYGEMQELSKKKPEATLSAAKIKILNRLLEDLRIILKEESELKYLDLIEDDSLPQYSDVVLMLSQYSAAMRSFYKTYYVRDSYTGLRDWLVK